MNIFTETVTMVEYTVLALDSNENLKLNEIFCFFLEWAK